IDSLVKSLRDSDIAPNSNVYAELGSTWRFLMRDPEQASHALGKLLRHVGEERVLWGTDSIWYGSPQDQIQAMRAFAMEEGFAARYGYPLLTPALKTKIFGLNGARVYGVDPAAIKRKAATDPIGRRKLASLEAPSFETFGPRTRAEYLALKEQNGPL
ncbi:MAG TPA: amidohydrolase family protein, partial [Stellaceae bacterium]|nr:amidohydrolase family protein [Stellaceae bacterium]